MRDEVAEVMGLLIRWLPIAGRCHGPWHAIPSLEQCDYIVSYSPSPPSIRCASIVIMWLGWARLVRSASRAVFHKYTLQHLMAFFFLHQMNLRDNHWNLYGHVHHQLLGS